MRPLPHPGYTFHCPCPDPARYEPCEGGCGAHVTVLPGWPGRMLERDHTSRYCRLDGQHHDVQRVVHDAPRCRALRGRDPY